MQRKSFAKKSRQMKNGISYFNIKKTIRSLKQAKQDKNHRKNNRKTNFYDESSESFSYLICATPKSCIHLTGQSRFKRPLFLAKVGSGGNTPRTVNTISGKFSCGSLPQIAHNLGIPQNFARNSLAYIPCNRSPYSPARKRTQNSTKSMTTEYI
jgi:hypothetical protein